MNDDDISCSVTIQKSSCPIYIKLRNAMINKLKSKSISQTAEKYTEIFPNLTLT